MRFRKGIAVASLAVVPLVVAGLFVGALSDADDAVTRVPAAVVNDDEMVQQTLPDGTAQPVLAGRLLVTELTAEDAQAFDWVITNGNEAESMLESGEVYAVLTVPEDFSRSITSLSSDAPQRAELTIETDDAHGYLTGAATQAVGTGMVSVFGNAITEQYIGGIYTSIGELGGSLQRAADGATELSAGATSLGDGVSQLSGGVAVSEGGAAAIADGVSAYTGGVDRLSSGLRQLDSGAEGLTRLGDGVEQYTDGVGDAAAGFSQLKNQLLETGLLQVDQAAPLVSALDEIESGFAEIATQGSELSGRTTDAISGIRGGISDSAAGAARLASGSSELRSGTLSLRDGLGELSAGASGVATGADTLASGASALATGLESGAAQVPAFDSDKNESAARVAADPVGLTVIRDNEVTDVAHGVSTLVLPIGLWLGALAIFLAARPLPRRLLASAAPTGRLLGRSLGRASAVAAGQAVLLVAFLHLAVGVDWALLPATLGFSLLMAVAFTAFHYLLTVAFGRAGLIVSFLALAVQLTSTGGLYPIELVARPFQAISPFLPLTHGVSGLQAILTGGGGFGVACVALALFGGVSVLLASGAVRRSRRAGALGLVPRVA